jgi:hypothetical protein
MGGELLAGRCASARSRRSPVTHAWSARRKPPSPSPPACRGPCGAALAPRCGGAAGAAIRRTADARGRVLPERGYGQAARSTRGTRTRRVCPRSAVRANAPRYPALNRCRPRSCFRRAREVPRRRCCDQRHHASLQSGVQLRLQRSCAHLTGSARWRSATGARRCPGRARRGRRRPCGHHAH